MTRSSRATWWRVSGDRASRTCWARRAGHERHEHGGHGHQTEDTDSRSGRPGRSGRSGGRAGQAGQGRQGGRGHATRWPRPSRRKTPGIDVQWVRGLASLRHRSYVRARCLRGGRGSDGVGRVGTGTGTTVNPSIPVKSFGLQVYNGSRFARAVAAIITS